MSRPSRVANETFRRPRSFFSTAAILAVCLGATRIVSAEPSPAATDDLAGGLPNVVIVLADDLGYQDLGCFGSPDLKTPNLDRMAAEGIRFTSFCVAQSVCSASRAALLTGCYPNRIGIAGALSPKAEHGLNSQELTLADVVKKRGYKTALYGKWHLGHHPEFLPARHGFDEFFGLPFTIDLRQREPAAPRSTGLFEMAPSPTAPLPPTPLGKPPRPTVPGPATRRENLPELLLMEGTEVVETSPDESTLTTRFTDRAVRFIGNNRARPFLLIVAYNMPHVPLAVSEKFQGTSERGLYGDVIAELDWSVGANYGGTRPIGPRRQDARDLHFRQRALAGSGRPGRVGRRLARRQGDHLRRWSSGALHYAVARPNPSGVGVRRTGRYHRSVAHHRFGGWCLVAARPDHRRPEYLAPDQRRRERIDSARCLLLLLGRSPSKRSAAGGGNSIFPTATMAIGPDAMIP